MASSVSHNLFSQNIYALYKQLHPPTVIDFAIYCNFTSSSKKCLVVCGGNFLRVFHLQSPETSETDPEPKSTLELVLSRILFGPILAINYIRIHGNETDSLVLCFPDGKISVVSYNQENCDIVTVYIHHFDDDDDLNGERQTHPFPPIIATDPDMRCCVVLVKSTHLVVLSLSRKSLYGELETAKALSHYVINLKMLEDRMSNIADIRFLHGYYEPTLAVLHEPVQTWSGRIAVRQDTFTMAAMSINLEERSNPVIWTVGNLPYDCHMILAMPKPTGGVLIVGVNCLIYLNQSMPPYGVSLNSLTENTTSFPLIDQPGPPLSLDGCQCAWINQEEIVVAQRTGVLHVLQLILDITRSVKGFYFDKYAASVLPSCLTLLDSGFLFLGSASGNSLLLRYALRDNESMLPPTKAEPPSKKKRLNTAAEWEATDLEDLLATNQEDAMLRRAYTFSVSDSLLNIGPISSMVAGKYSSLAEEFIDKKAHQDVELELVCCSGVDKNGSLSVLSRSIKPQIVTTFSLPGCYDMWTVFDKGDDFHSTMILSRDDSTMALQTGEEIQEVDDSGFITDDPTVFAGNIGSDGLVIQVTPTSISLLRSGKEIQTLTLQLLGHAVECALSDRHVLILSDSGKLLYVTLDDSSTGLVMTNPEVDLKSKVMTLCLYNDASGMFVMGSTRQNETKPKPARVKEDFEDEDDLLYGDSYKDDADAAVDSAQDDQASYTSLHWAAMYTENGALEIYSVPDFHCCFHVGSFPFGPKVASHMERKWTVATAWDARSQGTIQELLLIGLGPTKSQPFLFAIRDEELFIYSAFPSIYKRKFDQQPINIKFKRVYHESSIRVQRIGRLINQSQLVLPETPYKSRRKFLRSFSDINDYSGVFLGGGYPHWIIMTHRLVSYNDYWESYACSAALLQMGAEFSLTGDEEGMSRNSLRIHPMTIDGPVQSFAPFNNVNCPKGFLYFNLNEELRVSLLPGNFTYDSYWPVRKVPLKATPHHVVYHLNSDTYIVSKSVAELTNQVPKIPQDDTLFENIDRGPRFMYPTRQVFCFQLYDPRSWEPIPHAVVELQSWEHITDLKICFLRDDSGSSKEYIVIGTNLNLGEEVPSRGRIAVYEAYDAVDSADNATKAVKLVTEEDKKGAVSAVCAVSGNLLTAIGQRIYIWQLKDESELVGMAFIDSQFYVHRLVALKTFVLVGDVYGSISLLKYYDTDKILSYVSRDYKQMEVYSCDFLVDNSNLSFVVSDSLKNLMVYHYQPELKESLGGTRLLRRADINPGTLINSFLRLRVKLDDPGSGSWDRATSQKLLERRQVTYMSTLDGSLGYLIPVQEKTYRRLLMLQNLMVTYIPHVAGCNPKGFRTVRYPYRELRNPNKNILDGDLLWRFCHLTFPEKEDLATKIGTLVSSLMDDLNEFHRQSSHF